MHCIRQSVTAISTGKIFINNNERLYKDTDESEGDHRCLFYAKNTKRKNKQNTFVIFMQNTRIWDVDERLLIN